ncbi:MAG TPA: protein kinase, partial [Blastocatellia bacterium]|nr:protein kinase [Blastocatellia bacterium]
MDAERWRQIEELYHSALALGEDARSLFLDQACSGDENLRREIDSLLQYQDRAEHFIETPAIEVAAALMIKDHMASVVGMRVGPYEIRSLIATGGMGEVYLAEDTRLGRRVALKLLMKESTRDHARVRRFEQEARAASALNHPNILTVYDISEVDGTQCIVTEFIEGQTLRQQMIAGRMNVKDATDIAAQVASALAAAHDAGIVHRDIKPENIMVRRDGYVKVLDFGLAKLARPHAFFKPGKRVSTDEGIVMGTVNYMSPEQARGQLVDVRSDIFSFGCVLYEMVCGHTPFEGETNADVIAAILEKPHPEVGRFTSDVPDLLEGIIDRALQKDRLERFQTAEELLAELKSLKQRLEFEDELERSMSGSRLIQIATLNAAATADTSPSDLRARQSGGVIDSLAILPFGNLPAETQLEYFSEGITESIINTLSRIPELRVMAWSTVCAYKDRQVDPRAAGRDLGVRGVVTGRLIRQGNQFVLKIELVDATDGSQVWSEACICKPSDILELEAGICKEISEKLLVRLSSEERGRLSRLYTQNTEAYHAYLKGRYFWNKRTDESVRQGIGYFKEAIDIDPGYALAYSGLADAYLILGSFGIATMEPGEAFPKAREAARRALDYDDELAEAHASLATSLASYYWDWPAAEREFKRSIELKPGYPTSHHWYGFIYLASMGRLEEAIAELKRAQELDPLSITIASDTGLIYYLAGQYDLAIETHRKTAEMDKSFVYSYWKLGLAYEQKRMYEEAIEEYEKAVALCDRSKLPMAQLGRVHALAGDSERARSILSQLKEQPNDRYVSSVRLAAIHVALGETDQAFEWLQRGFDERDSGLIWLKVNPHFRDLHSDARFETLVRRIGLGGAIRTAETLLRGATVLEPIGHTVLKGLAVLPFKPISAEHSDEYLELGIADALITKLSNVAQIVVRPTSAVRKYTGSDQDASR